MGIFSLAVRPTLRHFRPRHLLARPTHSLSSNSDVNANRTNSKPTNYRRALMAAAVTSAVGAACLDQTQAEKAHLPKNNAEALASTQAASDQPFDQGQPPSTAAVSRAMLPDAANPAGNVHGGTILSMVDEAGWTAATRYMNQKHTKDAKPACASLARIEKVDFLKPMFIGEIAEVTAQVTHTSPHSIEVEVNVVAENVMTGQKRTTNRARAWYVSKEFRSGGNAVSRLLDSFGQDPRKNMPGSRDLEKDPVMAVPRMKYASEAEMQAGLARYEKQKQSRDDRDTIASQHPVEEGDATLIHVLHPSDCHANGVAQAGAVLKLMDTAAGVVSVRHCRSNAVTASLEAVDFMLPLYNGDLLEIAARPVFTSKRSMDVEVNVYAQSLNKETKSLAATSIFTFVSLDRSYRVQDVPAFEPRTDSQRARFELGLKRYETRKAERAEAAKATKA